MIDSSTATQDQEQKKDRPKAPFIMGVQLVPDPEKRVVGWTTPKGSPFYARVYESKNVKKRWTCVIGCGGFGLQVSDRSMDVVRMAEDRILTFLRAFAAVES